jgi:hypothetical protein
LTASFIPAQQIEWMDIPTVTRILRCTPQQVLELLTGGILNGRTVGGETRISSASVDAFTAGRPLVQPAPPPTYVRHGNGYRLEVE